MKIRDDKIIPLVVAGSLLLLLVLSLIGFLAISSRFACGAVAGGVISLINFFWLSNALRQVLRLPAQQAGRYAQIRYIFRLAIMGAVLYVLVVVVKIDVFGLVSGLSVIPLSVGVLALYRLTFKGGF